MIVKGRGRPPPSPRVIRVIMGLRRNSFVETLCSVIETVAARPSLARGFQRGDIRADSGDLKYPPLSSTSILNNF